VVVEHGVIIICYDFVCPWTHHVPHVIQVCVVWEHLANACSAVPSSGATSLLSPQALLFFSTALCDVQVLCSDWILQVSCLVFAASRPSRRAYSVFAASLPSMWMHLVHLGPPRWVWLAAAVEQTGCQVLVRYCMSAACSMTLVCVRVVCVQGA
jgi:hypothetical protein